MKWFFILLLFLWSGSAFGSPQEEAALNAFQDAMSIKLGLPEYQRQAEVWATAQTMRLGITTPLAALGFVYKTIRIQRVEVPVWRDKLTLTPNSVEISIPL